MQYGRVRDRPVCPNRGILSRSIVRTNRQAFVGDGAGYGYNLFVWFGAKTNRRCVRSGKERDGMCVCICV